MTPPEFVVGAAEVWSDHGAVPPEYASKISGLGGWTYGHREDQAGGESAAGPVPNGSPGAAVRAAHIYAQLDARRSLGAEGARSGVTVHPVETEILAWRGWHLDRESWWAPRLASVNYHTVWETPVLRADEVPTAWNTNGIHALRAKPSRASEDFWDYFALSVYGEVALSGTVVEGDRGYRAEQAIVRRLWVANPGDIPTPLRTRWSLWSLAAILAHHYEVEVDVDPGPWRRHPTSHLVAADVSVLSAVSVALAVPPDDWSARLSVVHHDSNGNRIRSHKRLDGTTYEENLGP